MRPVRITGITGDSPAVPLDTYAPSAQTIVQLSGAGQLQYTIDNVFDLSIAPTWTNTPAAVDGAYIVQAGVRAVRATGMAPADVLLVSQQALA